MNQGVLIFAHNSRDVDYALMSIISGGLAKKNLGRPASLVADNHTIDWMKESGTIKKADEVFEHIIEIPKPKENNTRKLADGTETKVVPFVNSNRCDALDLSPYERTLLIDSDFLIFSDRLNAFWEVDSSVMISPCMVDIRGDRVGVLDRWIADTGIPMYWATTVMFTKNKEAETFFKLVDFIKKNYDLYSSIYRFNPGMYRNDISFSVAKHIMDGFETDRDNNLPGVLTSQDKDLIYDVTESGIKILMADPMSQEKVTIGNFSGSDLHIMNKQAIVRFADKFLSMI